MLAVLAFFDINRSRVSKALLKRRNAVSPITPSSLHHAKHLHTPLSSSTAAASTVTPKTALPNADDVPKAADAKLANTGPGQIVDKKA